MCEILTLPFRDLLLCFGCWTHLTGKVLHFQGHLRDPGYVTLKVISFHNLKYHKGRKDWLFITVCSWKHRCVRLSTNPLYFSLLPWRKHQGMEDNLPQKLKRRPEVQEWWVGALGEWCHELCKMSTKETGCLENKVFMLKSWGQSEKLLSC